MSADLFLPIVAGTATGVAIFLMMEAPKWCRWEAERLRALRDRPGIIGFDSGKERALAVGVIMVDGKLRFIGPYSGEPVPSSIRDRWEARP